MGQVRGFPPNRRRRIRGLVGLVVILLAVWTAGCATMRGLGEDIQSLGRGIKKVFTDP